MSGVKRDPDAEAVVFRAKERTRRVDARTRERRERAKKRPPRAWTAWSLPTVHDPGRVLFEGTPGYLVHVGTLKGMEVDWSALIFHPSAERAAELGQAFAFTLSYGGEPPEDFQWAGQASTKPPRLWPFVTGAIWTPTPLVDTELWVLGKDARRMAYYAEHKLMRAEGWDHRKAYFVNGPKKIGAFDALESGGELGQAFGWGRTIQEVP